MEVTDDAKIAHFQTVILLEDLVHEATASLFPKKNQFFLNTFEMSPRSSAASNGSTSASGTISSIGTAPFGSQPELLITVSPNAHNPK